MIYADNYKYYKKVLLTRKKDNMVLILIAETEKLGKIKVFQILLNHVTAPIMRKKVKFITIYFYYLLLYFFFLLDFFYYFNIN